MDARTLAVSAGAGPKIVEQPRIIRKGGRITSKDYVNAEVDHSEFDAWCANHPYTVTSPEMDRAVQNLIGRMDAALTIVRPYPPQ